MQDSVRPRLLLLSLLLLTCGALARAAAPEHTVAAAPDRTLYLDGRKVTLCFDPITAGTDSLVWIRDFEQTGRVRTRWEPRTHTGVIASAGTVLEVQVGVPEMKVLTTSTIGDVSLTQSLSAPPALVNGRLMVPLTPVCQALGLSTVPPPAPPLAAEDHPDPQARGAIVGEVRFAGRPVEGIVLRLVRADSTFLRDRRAVSDGHGRYRFPGVPAGQYRVYAYVGDNPSYFNRQTALLEVKQALLTAPSLALGWIITPRFPSPGARVSLEKELALRWDPCPGAAAYELTVADAEGAQPVMRQRVTAPEAAIAAEALPSGHTYHVRVVAQSRDGAFLGSTPSVGSQPWAIDVPGG